ncbi:dTMP kinase [Marinobacterium litorale]|uniref:dTMP kinase n=1 Tax=Marinobacterium litorale TaxID=404770 RepID=UPI00068857EC|nr:dTMP kinase [Marinobacterium litorale]
MPRDTKGILVVFDGIDGAGKTTQVTLLADLLRKVGLGVTTSKEPTDGQWGKVIRESAKIERMPIAKELQYFILDRKEHLEEIVTPALEAGNVVILDRYYYSTICYQGARGEDKEKLRDTVMSAALLPDISFILDVNPLISQDRIKNRDGLPNKFEDFNELVKVREIYEWLCHVDKTLYEIDSSLTIMDIHYSIVNILIDTVLKDKFCFKDYGCDDVLGCGYRMSGTCEWANIRESMLLGLEKPKKYPALKYHKP